MCTTTCIIFGATNLTRSEVEGKTVLEIGSRDVNGSLRPIIESFGPSKYIGIDISYGPGVDVVCDAEDILNKFGYSCFDIVISTELIEHVRNWRAVISNIKNICKPKGTILLTTRSIGFGYHGFPYDFWRFEIVDMKNIFSDCIIDKLETDRISPGVFLKAIKPEHFIENDLNSYNLYSIILNNQIRDIDDIIINTFMKKYETKHKLDKIITTVLKKGRSILNILGFNL